MNYREKYIGTKEDFYSFLKDETLRLFKDKLKIEGTRVLIPDNEELDFQIKLDSDEDYGDLSIKVKWGQKPQQESDLDEKLEDANPEPLEF